MTKEELIIRLNDIEWDDFEVKEASGGPSQIHVGDSQRIF